MPFLLAGEIGAVGVIVALAISSTIVDVSPFSTNGALVLANAQGVDRDVFYKQILKYSALVVAIGPVIAWAYSCCPAGSDLQRLDSGGSPVAAPPLPTSK